MMGKKASFYLGGLLLVAMVFTAQSNNVRFELNETSCGFRFYINKDKLWFQSDGVFATFKGTQYSSEDKSLILKSVEPVQKNTDGLGEFSLHAFVWTASPSFILITYVKIYSLHDSVIFGQKWPLRTEHTNSTGDISSSFPAFQAHDPNEVGILSFNGRFLEGSRSFPFSQGDRSIGGERGGPVVLFDEKGVNTLAIAPLTNAMATGVHHEKGKFSTGLLGTIEKVPEKFVLETLVSYNAGDGITSETRILGQKMLTYFKTKEPRAEALRGDISLNSIGYITDNGSYYYYLTEKNQTYEETLLSVYEDSINRGIPIRYIQLDSWWYRQGKYGGVKNWTEMSHIFPNGLRSFSAKTGWPLFLHNRYWAVDNVYITDYDFIVEDRFAIPTEQRFWDDLMKNASNSGMTVYEQDWLYNEFEGLNATLRSATLGTEWLHQMGNAAALYNVTLQYCMTLPRMVLEAARIPSVTQVRAGEDYHPNNTQGCSFPHCQYYIHTSSLILWALDLMPSKDIFWTSAVQPGTRYGPPGSMEPHSEMLALVAIMSRGPVHFGDKVGYTDPAIVVLTSTLDGRLLKPSRPATAVDACFVAAAFPGTTRQDVLSEKGKAICGVMSSHTKLAGQKFAHLFAILLPKTVPIVPSDIPLDMDQDFVHLVYSGYGKPDNVTIVGLFSSSHPLTMPSSGISNFTLFHTTPLLPNHPVVLLGEMEKFVPISEDRFERISFERDQIVLDIKGFPGEVVTVSFANRRNDDIDEVFQVQCVVKADKSVKMDSKGNCGGATWAELTA